MWNRDKDNNCVIFKIKEGLKIKNNIDNVKVEIKKLWLLFNIPTCSVRREDSLSKLKAGHIPDVAVSIAEPFSVVPKLPLLSFTDLSASVCIERLSGWIIVSGAGTYWTESKSIKNVLIIFK